MNKEFFVKQIEDSRSYDSELLELAVCKGISKSKNDVVGVKKVIVLAVAVLLTVILFFVMNAAPLNIFADDYFQNRSNLLFGGMDMGSMNINSVNDLLEYWSGE